MISQQKIDWCNQVNQYFDDLIAYLNDHKEAIVRMITDAPCTNVSMYYSIPCDGDLPVVSFTVDHLPGKGGCGNGSIKQNL